jgi:hypothetical protein
VVVPKNGGKIRMCIDYQALNDITEQSAYPLPRIEQILDTFTHASIFSNMDVTSGYFYIAM